MYAAHTSAVCFSIPAFAVRSSLRGSPSPENHCFSPRRIAGSPRKMLTKASIFTFAKPIAIRSRNASSLYQVLRVEQTASQGEIKAAYRSLAKLYHPDAIHHHQSDGCDFIALHNAYETLSDPAARAHYDLSLEAAAHFCSNRKSTVGCYSTRRWETDQCW